MDIRAIAAQLMADPMFAHLTPEDQEADARAALERAGAEPAKVAAMAPLLVRAVLAPTYRTAEGTTRRIATAARGPKRPQQTAAPPARRPQQTGTRANGDTFLARFARATGMTDADLCELLGVSRVSVHAKRMGKNKAPLPYDQVARMVDILRDRLHQIRDLLDEAGDMRA